MDQFWRVGTLKWDDLVSALESTFSDPDRERRLMSKLQSF